MLRLSFTIAALIVAVGCAGPQQVEPSSDYESLVGRGTRAPANEAERAITAELGTLPDGGTLNANGQVVQLGVPYVAASGRRCRAVQFVSGGAVACEFAGTWSWVPQVVSPAGSPGGEATR